MKKLLALVLALVMVLGLATVGTSAAYSDFTDTADVSYEEAMKVMNAVGVFVGDNGKLNPKGNLTRAQAAKLVAYLALGEDIAEALPKTGSKFTDAPDGAWFTGYVNYMANEGYTDGTSPTTYSPNGTLTGYQFGAFLLAVLGYDRELEGMTGSGWETKVAVKLEELDITKGVSKLGSAALTREEAAQFCLNALKATCVKYDDKGTSIDLNGAKITTGAKAASNVTTDNDTNAIKAGGTVQLGEKLYKGDLKLQAVGKDDFGRPANEWTYKNNDVVTAAKTADKTYVVAKSGKNVKTILTDGSYMGINKKDIDLDEQEVTLWVNGFKVSTDYTAYDEEVVLQIGDTVEAFYEDDYVATVVVSRYFAAEIDKLSTSISSAYAAEGATTAITLKKTGQEAYAPATTVLYDAYKADSDKVLAGFDAATYTKGAVIAVAPLFKSATAPADTVVILDSYVVTTQTGKITNFKATEYITLAGTKYTGIGRLSAKIVDANLGFDNDFELYLDKNGYILDFDGDPTVALKDVYYVDSVYAVKGNTGSLTFYAIRVGLDGVKDEVKLETTDFAALMGAADLHNANTSTVYTVKTTAKGYVKDDLSAVYVPVASATHAADKFFTTTNDGTSWGNALGEQGLATALGDQGNGAWVKLSVAEKTLYSVQGLYTFKDNSTALGRKSNDGKFAAIEYTGADSNGYVMATVNGAVINSSVSVSYDNAAKHNSVGDTSATVFANDAGKAYINSDTKFLSIEDSGDSMTVKTATGKMTIADNTPVIVIFADGKTDAAYVIYYAEDIASVADTTDIYYLASKPSVRNSDDSYAAVLRRMDNVAETKDVNIDAARTVGFYIIDKEEDDVLYLKAYDAALNDDPNVPDVNFTTTKDGGVLNVSITGVKNGTLSGTADAGMTGMNDIKVASDLVIIDSRSDANKDRDVYRTEITDLETLEDAVDDGYVIADVYFEDGKVAFVAVTAAENNQWVVEAAVKADAPAGTVVDTNATTVSIGETVTVTVTIPADVACKNGAKAKIELFRTKGDDGALSNSITNSFDVTAEKTVVTTENKAAGETMTFTFSTKNTTKATDLKEYTIYPQITFTGVTDG